MKDVAPCGAEVALAGTGRWGLLLQTAPLGAHVDIEPWSQSQLAFSTIHWFYLRTVMRRSSCGRTEMFAFVLISQSEQ